MVKYDIPQGERRGIDVDLTDATYDGIVDGQRLSGGLGQLTDGELGQSNFRAVDRRGTGIKASYISCPLKHSYCYKGRGFYVSWFCLFVGRQEGHPASKNWVLGFVGGVILTGALHVL